MADGTVRAAPYSAVVGITNWATAPGIWHELSGEYIGRGIDLQSLEVNDFLNLIYSEMLKRLSPKKGQTMDDARRALDQRLRVSSWGLPGLETVSQAEYDPSVPYWWGGAEEASQSFLKSMGVAL